MERVIFDAEGCTAGRIASIAAKELLKGKFVEIVNAEKALISGNPRYNFLEWQKKVKRGHVYKGPFYPKQPDRILKRIIRGMLPFKKPKGKAAFKRLRVYISMPSEIKENPIKPEGSISNLKKSITLGELSEKLGAKKVW